MGVDKIISLADKNLFLGNLKLDNIRLRNKVKERDEIIIILNNKIIKLQEFIVKEKMKEET